MNERRQPRTTNGPATGCQYERSDRSQTRRRRAGSRHRSSPPTGRTRLGTAIPTTNAQRTGAKANAATEPKRARGGPGERRRSTKREVVPTPHQDPDRRLLIPQMRRQHSRRRAEPKGKEGAAPVAKRTTRKSTNASPQPRPTNARPPTERRRTQQPAPNRKAKESADDGRTPTWQHRRSNQHPSREEDEKTRRGEEGGGEMASMNNATNV